MSVENIRKIYEEGNLNAALCFVPEAVLGEEERLVIVDWSLASLVRVGRAFPALVDDLLHLLVLYGRVASAQAALSTAPAPKCVGEWNMTRTVNVVFVFCI